ncbi:MAG: Di-heme cytochrome c peroxidase [Gemmatimonadetes bacterium]|nr:Di-heme cytochrome c peroxidase [Gemmatimonadota bacterium]
MPTRVPVPTVTHAKTSALVMVLVSVFSMTTSVTAGPARGTPRWSAAEQATLRSLSLSSLAPLSADPSNRYGDDSAAASLGRALFFEERLSANGKVSCASCHSPAQDFQDGKPLATGVGTTARRTMSIAGTAHSPWLFWDGRADSQWGQALGPLESAAEHGGSRTQYAHVIDRHYRADYQAVFGLLPDLGGVPERAGPIADTAATTAWQHMTPVRRDEITRVYANIGKAIAAYERRINVSPSRFDRYVDAEVGGKSHTSESALSSDEEAGLKLFIGRGNCVNCHNGPLLTDNHFHNTGVPTSATVAAPDSGRVTGVRQVLAGEFNCTSRYSDAKPDDCDELRFAVASGAELVRAYKTPSLRNVMGRPPYMHAGQLATVDAVLEHYSNAPAAPIGHSELKPLHLSPAERQQIKAFLGTLSSPLAAPPGFLTTPPARL